MRRGAGLDDCSRASAGGPAGLCAAGAVRQRASMTLPIRIIP